MLERNKSIRQMKCYPYSMTQLLYIDGQNER